MSSNAANEDAAAYWAIRLDGGPLDATEQQALDAWLAEDEGRAGALLRAEAHLAYLDRGRALGEAGVQAGSPFRDGFSRRAMIGGGLAGLAAAGVAAVVVTRAGALRIRTRIGEVRRVPLADGSVASINTDSRLSVAMQDHRRQVKLEDGEAWFQVAHDKARPFVVEAGEVRVQAVGTAFSVRRRDAGADVLVTEGVVEVWVAGDESARTRIAAGSRSFVSDAAAHVEVVSAGQEVDRALAWRTGELALNGESLAYAAAELNRYNVRKVVIEGEGLGAEPLIGFFRTDQPEGFAQAVAGMVGARVEAQGETIRLSR